VALSPRWDIFCKVVDNYGDAGVCWRLARELAAEHGIAPRLWIDRLETLARLAPQLDAARVEQTLAGVEVRCWAEPFPETEPGAVVIEAFGCDVPAPFAERMAQAERQPVWINLEHLTAEAWVDSCHLLPSRHARLPITRWFFYPGFSQRTGGLLREQGLLAARDRFQADHKAQDALWAEVGVPPRTGNELRLSLFCYDTPAATALLDTLAAGSRPARVLAPEGVALMSLQAVFGATPGRKPILFNKQNVTVNVVPFLPQERWDRVLWACDVNVVRGEDSFVRAQWAGRPFVWAIYPQTDDAHRKKMAAFLGRYALGLAAPAAGALAALHNAWDTSAGVAPAWPAFVEALPEVAAHGRRWAERLAGQPDLTRNIVEFASRV
jgi:uncharacterized repeat protein (TIGR03837 family)